MGRLRKIRRPNGEIIPFRQQRISRSISEAAKACGIDDATLADEMAGVVTLFLEKHFDDEDPPGVEDVREMIYKVLSETGHVRVARSFLNLGNLAPHETTEGEGESPRLPDVLSRETQLVLPWDRSRIVKTLCEETSLPEAEAEEVSRQVEDRMIACDLARVTTSLLREFVDVELAHRGWENALERHNLVGVSTSDVDRWLFPGPHDRVRDPEVECAGAILKTYTLNEMHSRAVAHAHTDGRVHIHGLAHPQRVERVFVDATGPLTPDLDGGDDFLLELTALLQSLRPLVRSQIVVTRFSEAFGRLRKGKTRRGAVTFVRRLIRHLTRDDVFGRPVFPHVTLQVHLTGDHLDENAPEEARAVRFLAEALLQELEQRPRLRGRLGLTFLLAASPPYAWPDSQVLNSVLLASRRNRGVGLLLLREEGDAGEGTLHADAKVVTLDVGAVAVNVPAALALADVRSLDDLAHALEGPVGLAMDALFEKYWFLRRSAPQTLKGIISCLEGGRALRIDGDEQGASVLLWGLPQAVAFLQRRGIVTEKGRSDALARILSCVDYQAGEARGEIKLRMTVGGVTEREARRRLLDATARLALKKGLDDLAAAVVMVDGTAPALPVVSPIMDASNQSVLTGGFLRRLGPGLPLPSRDGDELVNHVWLRQLFESTSFSYLETEECGEAFEVQEALFSE